MDKIQGRSGFHPVRAITTTGMMFLLLWCPFGAVPQESEEVTVQIHVDQGHPWRPPFGLERVGATLTVWAEWMKPELPPDDSLLFSFRRNGREGTTHPLIFPPASLRSVRVEVGDDIDEVVLLDTRKGPDGPRELARHAIARPEFEGAAKAQPSVRLNPVDLGTIFPPSDKLLLGPGQTTQLDVALLNRLETERSLELAVWFDGADKVEQRTTVLLGAKARQVVHLDEILPPEGLDRSTLNVLVTDDKGATVWEEKIPAMLVQNAPELPEFGATALRLRYDGPISVRDPATGNFSELPYEDGWDPTLKDIVVSLPNGTRYVFWRGASYIPFWAGKNNTGLCYEWAEILPPRPENAVDCVEPLMDKELRYGSVEVVESTAARVHIRWTYQSTDLLYNVWGDAAVEDYYFYPDGFGTRVLNLTRDPASEYELSEFIVLSAPETYPLEILPTTMVEALFLNGSKHAFAFPHDGKTPNVPMGETAIYRVSLHRDEGMKAIYFSPTETEIPSVIFGSFHDQGEMVTPAYWGSHWPLARGNATGSRIDERVHITPCHNSLMSWAGKRPRPLRGGLAPTVDSLGRSREMVSEQWAWLIGMTEVDDEALRAWAQSFANPPSLTAEGALLEVDAYRMERRAIGLRATSPKLRVAINPSVPCVNPVFEIADAAMDLVAVRLNGQAVPSDSYAWDGHTFWLGATLVGSNILELEF